MSKANVQLRALKGFTQAHQYVRRGGLFRRTRKGADELIRGGYAEEVLTPLQGLVQGAKQLGVGLVVAPGTKQADEIVREAARLRVGLSDQRKAAVQPKPEAGKGGAKAAASKG